MDQRRLIGAVVVVVIILITVYWYINRTVSIPVQLIDANPDLSNVKTTSIIFIGDKDGRFIVGIGDNLQVMSADNATATGLASAAISGSLTLYKIPTAADSIYYIKTKKGKYLSADGKTIGWHFGTEDEYKTISAIDGTNRVRFLDIDKNNIVTKKVDNTKARLFKIHYVSPSTTPVAAK